MEKTIRIDGMHCGHCQAAVEAALSALSGVRGVKVELSAGTATITADRSIPDAELATAVDEIGFLFVPSP